jgi:hypothetical protein
LEVIAFGRQKLRDRISATGVQSAVRPRSISHPLADFELVSAHGPFFALNRGARHINAVPKLSLVCGSFLVAFAFSV